MGRKNTEARCRFPHVVLGIQATMTVTGDADLVCLLTSGFVLASQLDTQTRVI